MKAKRKPATKAKSKSAAKAKRPQAAPNAPTPEFYRHLGQAYRDQEGDLGDNLLTIAEITAGYSIHGDEGERIFTAHKLHDMIDDFRQNWYNQHKQAASEAA
jgi:hypothetical protein